MQTKTAAKRTRIEICLLDIREPLKRARMLAEEIRDLDGRLSLEEREVIIRDALQSDLLQEIEGIEASVENGLKEN
jgi:hypothetical protein